MDISPVYHFLFIVCTFCVLLKKSLVGQCHRDFVFFTKSFIMSKKNQNRTVDKVVKTEFIQDYCNRGKKPQYRTRLNSEYSMHKWEFIANEQRRSGDGKF